MRSPSRYGAHSRPSLPAGIFGRRGGQLVVVVAGEERVPEPAQAQACRLRYAHYVPQAGNRVAEGVQAALGIFGRAGRGGKDHARSADGGRDRTRL